MEKLNGRRQNSSGQWTTISCNLPGPPGIGIKEVASSAASENVQETLTPLLLQVLKILHL